MRRREEALGMRTKKHPAGLVYPVVFHDGEHFPKDAKNTQSKSLREWNYPYPQFSETPEYLRFDKALQDVAKEIATMLGRAPKFKAGWPVVKPKVKTDTKMKLPRL